MFFVINKQKIYSYIIAVATIAILFCGSSLFQIQDHTTLQTSATEGRMLPIYNVDTKEKNVALTMNCAWSQLLMG